MVMKPEPWGEALDALGADGADRRRADAVGDAVHPGAGRASSPTRERLVFACGRYEGIDQRVLDHAATRAEVRRGLARRLRAQRRRGRRARDHRGGGPAAARASWATPSRWSRSPTRTGCWSTPSTPSPRPGAASTCPRCCCPATTPRSRPGGATQARRRTARAPAGPAAPEPAAATEWEIVPGAARRRRRAADPAAGLLGAGGAGQRRPRRHPGAARVARRRAGVDRHLVDLGRPQRAAGSSAPSAAGSRTAARPGTSAGSWSPPTCRAAAWAGALLDAHRGGRAARGHVVRRCSPGPAAPTTSGCTRRPATGCAPTSRRRPLAVILTKPVAELRPPGRIGFRRSSAAVADSLLGPVGRRTAPRHAPGGPRRAPATGGSATPPATTAQRPLDMHTIRFRG